MTDQIVSRATMYERGAAAALAGRPRDSHGMNPWAPAVPDWQAGYDSVATPSSDPCLAEVTQP